MFSDHCPQRQNALGSFEIPEVLKTIALIPVEELGVVHLGSTWKRLGKKRYVHVKYWLLVSDSKGYVDQVKNLFRGICGRPMKSENEPSSNSRYCDSNDQFISLLSRSGCLKDDLQSGADSAGLLHANHSSCRKSHQQSFDDILNEQKSTSLLDTTDREAQGSSVGITLEDLFQDN